MRSDKSWQTFASTRMWIAAGLLAVSAEAWATPQQTLPLIGHLKTKDSITAPDGQYGLKIELLENKGDLDANALFVEDEGKVQVTGGLFSVQIGAKQVLPVGLFASGKAAWVRLFVDGTSIGELPLQLAPYALRAEAAAGLQCSGCIGAGHLDASVLAPYVKQSTLAAVATSGSFADLANLPLLLATAQTCPTAQWLVGIDSGGKIVCTAVPAYTGQNFALANQSCASDQYAFGSGTDGKPLCGDLPSGKDFALANQVCIPGMFVTGVDAAGMPLCATPPATGALANKQCTPGAFVTGMDSAGMPICTAPPTYGGKDFALANQTCSAGQFVQGVDDLGKAKCLAPTQTLSVNNLLGGTINGPVTVKGELAIADTASANWTMYSEGAGSVAEPCTARCGLKKAFCLAAYSNGEPIGCFDAAKDSHCLCVRK